MPNIVFRRPWEEGARFSPFQMDLPADIPLPRTVEEAAAYADNPTFLSPERNVVQQYQDITAQVHPMVRETGFGGLLESIFGPSQQTQRRTQEISLALLREQRQQQADMATAMHQKQLEDVQAMRQMQQTLINLPKFDPSVRGAILKSTLKWFGIKNPDPAVVKLAETTMESDPQTWQEFVDGFGQLPRERAQWMLQNLPGGMQAILDWQRSEQIKKQPTPQQMIEWMATGQLPPSAGPAAGEPRPPAPGQVRSEDFTPGAPGAPAPGPVVPQPGSPATFTPTQRRTLTYNPSTGITVTLTQEPESYTSHSSPFGVTLIGRADPSQVLFVPHAGGPALDKTMIELVSGGKLKHPQLSRDDASKFLQESEARDLRQSRAKALSQIDVEKEKPVYDTSLRTYNYINKNLDDVAVMHWKARELEDAMRGGKIRALGPELGRRVGDIKTVERLLPVMKQIAEKTLVGAGAMPGANLVNALARESMYLLGKDVDWTELKTIKGVRLLMSRMMQGAAQQLSNLDVQITEGFTVHETDTLPQALRRLEVLGMILDAQKTAIWGEHPLPTRYSDFSPDVQRKVDVLRASPVIWER